MAVTIQLKRGQRFLTKDDRGRTVQFKRGKSGVKRKIIPSTKLEKQRIAEREERRVASMGARLAIDRGKAEVERGGDFTAGAIVRASRKRFPEEAIQTAATGAVAARLVEEEPERKAIEKARTLTQVQPTQAGRPEEERRQLELQREAEETAVSGTSGSRLLETFFGRQGKDITDETDETFEIRGGGMRSLFSKSEGRITAEIPDDERFSFQPGIQRTARETERKVFEAKAFKPDELFLKETFSGSKKRKVKKEQGFVTISTGKGEKEIVGDKSIITRLPPANLKELIQPRFEETRVFGVLGKVPVETRVDPVLVQSLRESQLERDLERAGAIPSIPLPKDQSLPRREQQLNQLFNVGIFGANVALSGTAAIAKSLEKPLALVDRADKAVAKALKLDVVAKATVAGGEKIARFRFEDHVFRQAQFFQGLIKPFRVRDTAGQVGKVTGSAVPFGKAVVRSVSSAFTQGPQRKITEPVIVQRPRFGTATRGDFSVTSPRPFIPLDISRSISERATVREPPSQIDQLSKQRAKEFSLLAQQASFRSTRLGSRIAATFLRTPVSTAGTFAIGAGAGVVSKVIGSGVKATRAAISLKTVNILAKTRTGTAIGKSLIAASKVRAVSVAAKTAKFTKTATVGAGFAGLAALDIALSEDKEQRVIDLSKEAFLFGAGFGAGRIGLETGKMLTRSVLERRGASFWLTLTPDEELFFSGQATRGRKKFFSAGSIGKGGGKAGFVGKKTITTADVGITEVGVPKGLKKGIRLSLFGEGKTSLEKQLKLLGERGLKPEDVFNLEKQLKVTTTTTVRSKPKIKPVRVSELITKGDKPKPRSKVDVPIDFDLEDFLDVGRSKSGAPPPQVELILDFAKGVQLRPPKVQRRPTFTQAQSVSDISKIFKTVNLLDRAPLSRPPPPPPPPQKLLQKLRSRLKLRIEGEPRFRQVVKDFDITGGDIISKRTVTQLVRPPAMKVSVGKVRTKVISEFFSSAKPLVTGIEPVEYPLSGIIEPVEYPFSGIEAQQFQAFQIGTKPKVGRQGLVVERQTLEIRGRRDVLIRALATDEFQDFEWMISVLERTGSTTGVPIKTVTKRIAAEFDLDLDVEELFPSFEVKFVKGSSDFIVKSIEPPIVMIQQTQKLLTRGEFRVESRIDIGGAIKAKFPRTTKIVSDLERGLQSIIAEPDFLSPRELVGFGKTGFEKRIQSIDKEIFSVTKQISALRKPKTVKPPLTRKQLERLKDPRLSKFTTESFFKRGVKGFADPFGDVQAVSTTRPRTRQTVTQDQIGPGGTVTQLITDIDAPPQPVRKVGLRNKQPSILTDKDFRQSAGFESILDQGVSSIGETKLGIGAGRARLPRLGKRVSPVLLTRTLTDLQQGQRALVGTRQAAASRLDQRQFTDFDLIEVQDTGIRSLLGQAQTQAQAQAQAQAQVTAPRLRTVGVSGLGSGLGLPGLPNVQFPFPPEVKPPTIIFPGFKLVRPRKLGRVSRKKKKPTREFRFTPSLFAVQQQIFGPRPKVLTGLEIRPIPVSRMVA